jgi:3-methyladenine DNA glycosylase Tag
MSRVLRRNGFGFVGSTSEWAFMQTVARDDDHALDCYPHPGLSASVNHD